MMFKLINSCILSTIIDIALSAPVSYKGAINSGKSLRMVYGQRTDVPHSHYNSRGRASAGISPKDGSTEPKKYAAKTLGKPIKNKKHVKRQDGTYGAEQDGPLDSIIQQSGLPRVEQPNQSLKSIIEENGLPGTEDTEIQDEAEVLKQLEKDLVDKNYEIKKLEYEIQELKKKKGMDTETRASPIFEVKRHGKELLEDTMEKLRLENEIYDWFDNDDELTSYSGIDKINVLQYRIRSKDVKIDILKKELQRLSIPVIIRIPESWANANTIPEFVPQGKGEEMDEGKGQETGQGKGKRKGKGRDEERVQGKGQGKGRGSRLVERALTGSTDNTGTRQNNVQGHVKSPPGLGKGYGHVPMTPPMPMQMPMPMPPMPMPMPIPMPPIPMPMLIGAGIAVPFDGKGQGKGKGKGKCRDTGCPHQ